MAKLNEKGHEVLDPTPVAVPVHFKRPPTLQEQIRSMVRSEELRRAASSQGMETFEEADDFAVGDDYDPRSPHELVFDPELGKEVSQEEAQVLNTARQEFDHKLKDAQKRPRQEKVLEEEKPTRRKKTADNPPEDEEF